MAAAMTAMTATPERAGGADAADAAEEEDSECMICFETLETRGGPVSLPCECRVAYCHHCWDRALAASMSACGRALCPSCRSPMHVDFDAESGRLFFRRAPSSSSNNSEPINEDDWRKRLYAQAKPLQIMLLQRYGALATVAAEGGGSAGSRAAGAEPTGTFTSTEVETESDAPRCVCGSRLTCTSARERVLAFIAEAPMPTPPLLLEHLMLRPPIVCDICTRQVEPRSRVWTCENGRRTVLHAVRYDVCEGCFAYYAFGIEVPSDPGNATEDSFDEHDDYSSDEEDKDDWAW